MPCYRPLQAYRLSGAVVFQKPRGFSEPLRLPCGQCIGCRLEKSRQWAVRCVHEASLWPVNSFVTLTYDDAHLPADGSLDKSEFQRFMKRLRKRRKRVRYFHCGEYGDVNGRPHYHALLFNVGFPDRVPWREAKGKSVSYRSGELESTWGLGHCEVGEVTFESAAYVARYVVKKVTGDREWEHYERVNPLTGELMQLEREYATMSRGSALGRGWFEQYAEDVYPLDRVISRGREAKPPRAYDKFLEGEAPVEFAELRAERARNMRMEDQTEERLVTRGRVAAAQFNLFAGRTL